MALKKRIARNGFGFYLKKFKTGSTGFVGCLFPPVAETKNQNCCKMPNYHVRQARNIA
jgi:hypothetical protein